MKKYADVASSCGVSASNGGTKDFTVEDIKSVISQHTDDYIALFNFFPMVDEDGVGPNPNVEEGLYTMTVSYNAFIDLTTALIFCFSLMPKDADSFSKSILYPECPFPLHTETSPRSPYSVQKK